MKEKLDPYMQPLYDALKDMIAVEKLDDYLKEDNRNCSVSLHERKNS